jgi:hypothetical protein
VQNAVLGKDINLLLHGFFKLHPNEKNNKETFHQKFYLNASHATT